MCKWQYVLTNVFVFVYIYIYIYIYTILYYSILFIHVWTCIQYLKHMKFNILVKHRYRRDKVSITLYKHTLYR